MLRSVLTAHSQSPDCAMDIGAVWALSMCRSLLLDLNPGHTVSMRTMEEHATVKPEIFHE